MFSSLALLSLELVESLRHALTVVSGRSLALLMKLLRMMLTVLRIRRPQSLAAPRIRRPQSLAAQAIPGL